MNIKTQEEPTEHSVINKAVKTDVFAEKLKTDSSPKENTLVTIDKGLE